MSIQREQLRRFPVLGELTDNELDSLLAHLTEVSVERGEYLFHEGEAGDAVYFVWDGVVVAERSIAEEAGTSKDLAILPAHSAVGDLVLADDAPRSASVRAEIPVRAYRLATDAFRQLTGECPPVAFKLFKALFAEASRRLRATNDELVAVYEVGRMVTAGGSTSKVAEDIIDRLLRRLRGATAIICRYHRPSNGLRVVYAVGEKTDSLLHMELPLSGTLLGRCYDERRPFLVEQLLGATEPWESPSMIFTPLIVEDSAQGVLLIGSGAGTEVGFRVSQMSMVAAVANISARLLCSVFPPES